MLLLKMTLVPLFLWLITWIGRRFGPSTAGWLAGLPLVTGPILFLLALEYGAAFAERAATGALTGVFASMAFTSSYARLAQSRPWSSTLGLSMTIWTAATVGLAQLDAGLALSAAIALGSLLAAPALFPRVKAPSAATAVTRLDLVVRMAAGAGLTLVVTGMAPWAGVRLSGLLAVFPVLSVVLSVATHRTNGAAFTATLLRALAGGMYAFTAFCVAVAIALPRLPIGWAFLVAIAVCLTVQALSGMARTWWPRST